LSVAVQVIGELFPHEGGVMIGRGLGGVEECGAGSPHDGWGNAAGFVGADDVGELRNVFEAEDDHKGFGEMRVCLGGGVLRWRVQIQVEREKGGDLVEFELAGFFAPFVGEMIFVDQVEEGLSGVQA